MMAEKLTDDQLRKALIELGEVNIGAVTASTRPIYLKKLNHLRAKQKQSGNARGGKSTSKKLLGFSSDESENDDREKPATGRRRVPATRQTPRRRSNQQVLTPSTGHNNNVSIADKPAETTAGLARPGLRTRQSNRRKNVASTSHNVSRDDVDVAPTRRSSRMNRSFNDSNNSSHKSQSRSKFTDNIGLQVSMGNESQTVEDDFDLDDIPDDFESSDSDLDVHKVPDSATSSPEYVNKSINTSFPIDSSYVSPETSYVRPNSGRLSAFSSSSFYGSTSPVQRTKSPNSVTRKPATYVQPARNYVHTSKKTTANSVPGYPFKVEETTSWQNSVAHYISMFLVILFALFFVFIGIMYWNMRHASPQDSSLDKSNWMPCSENEPPCLTREEINGVKSIIVDLGEMLSSRAGNSECGYVETSSMTMDEIKNSLQLKDGDQKHLTNLLQLISKNKHWMIRLLTKDGQVTDSNVYAMESTSPALSLVCRLTRSMHKVFSILFILVIVALLISAGVSVVRWYWRSQEEETRNVYNLVEKIIDILKNHSDDCQDNAALQPCLAIPHVRDMLIPLKERRRKQSLWDKAVKFLSANESRVRVEMKTIEGEEFAVWRWLQACPNGSKVWQGQAFGDGQDGGGPRYSLSPCLKIRNMFDLDVEYGNDWHVYIQNALLEKCSLNHNILHIAVDKTSSEGCVYIKCKDDRAAGKAYKLLHGWWFDGNLVTVKYLRLERYHERFPDSINYREPLRPSNDEKLSLSQPFPRSIMEKS